MVVPNPLLILLLTKLVHRYGYSNPQYSSFSHLSRQVHITKEHVSEPPLRCSVHSGAKAHFDFATFAARLKSCPVTKQTYAQIP
jgi:hypothetical protein